MSVFDFDVVCVHFREEYQCNQFGFVQEGTGYEYADGSVGYHFAPLNDEGFMVKLSEVRPAKRSDFDAYVAEEKALCEENLRSSLAYWEEVRLFRTADDGGAGTE